MKFTIKGELWEYDGPAGWRFVYVSDKDSARIKKSQKKRVGFGFVPIKAILGKSEWRTTLFPTKEGPYLIAVKASVRKKEKVHAGDLVAIKCELV